jgi:hypothetical protein
LDLADTMSAPERGPVIKRREYSGILGVTAADLPLSARAQQTAMP